MYKMIQHQLILLGKIMDYSIITKWFLIKCTLKFSYKPKTFDADKPPVIKLMAFVRIKPLIT